MIQKYTKNLQISFALFLSIYCSVTLSAQAFNAVDKYPIVLKGTSYKDTITSSIDIRTINSLIDPMGDMTITIKDLPANKFEVSFTFVNPSFLGSKFFEINTLGALPTINVKYRYNLSVVASIVNAKDDFVRMTDPGQVIKIDPLANDVFNDALPKKIYVTDTKFGSSKVVNDLVEYKVPSGIDEDIITYTVENAAGTQDKAMILLYRNKTTNKDEIKNIVISEYSSFTIALPSHDNSILVAPTFGSLNQVNDQIFQYENDQLGNGKDKISFRVGKYLVTYNIQLKSKDTDLGLVKDDEVYAAVNQTITFDVLDNDLSKGSIFNYSLDLTHLGNGKFSYTPPASFVGTKKFFYDAGSRLEREVGNITIHVGNIAPSNNFVYNFTVKKGQSHTFSYETPLSGYSFNIESNPRKGSASAYQQIDPILLECGKIEGKGVIEYWPTPGFIGKDSMVISYRIGNQSPRNYMLRYQIIDGPDDCDCGTDCVWPGDVNRDGVVSPMDLLGVGKAYGDVGNARTQKTTAWSGYGSPDWLTNPLRKNADTNGDGIINRLDIQAIKDNLGKTSALVASTFGSGRSFQFKLVPQQSVVDSGDLIAIDIVVGDDVDPLLDVYGIGFNVRIPVGFLHESSIQVKFDEQSWLGHQSPLLSLSQRDGTGLIISAISRTHDKGISGKGVIGTIYGVVKDEFEGFFDEDAPYSYQNIIPSGMVLENSDGVKQEGKSAPIVIQVNRKKTNKVTVIDQVDIFPNPSQGEILVSLKGQDKINKIEIFDLSGHLIKTYTQQDSKQVAVMLDGLENGIYFSKITTDTNQITKRFVIAK
jgi:hypothetical protein